MGRSTRRDKGRRAGASKDLAGRAGGVLKRPQLTPTERRLGWVFFALYLFVFPFLVGGVVRVLDEGLDMTLTPAQSSGVYYGVVLVVFVAAFWEFLKNAGRILTDNPRGALFAFAAALAAGVAGTCLLSLIPLPVQNPVRTDYPQQFALSPLATTLVVVFLRPAVEEFLFRGLLFGSVRRHSRVLAYVLSAGVFALSAVWQFAFPEGGAAYLLLAVQYVPMGLALAWAYDVSGSVYTPMAARAAMSGIFLALALKGG